MYFKPKLLCIFKNEVNQLPVKNKKITIKNRFFNYLILKKDDKIVLQQRTDKDIWQQLYELPLVETLQDNEEDLFEYLSALFPESTIKKITPNAIKHKLSHQQLHISFYKIQVADFDTKHLVVPLNQLDLYAYPIVLWNFLKDFFKLEKN